MTDLNGFLKSRRTYMNIKTLEMIIEMNFRFCYVV